MTLGNLHLFHLSCIYIIIVLDVFLIPSISYNRTSVNLMAMDAIYNFVRVDITI